MADAWRMMIALPLLAAVPPAAGNRLEALAAATPAPMEGSDEAKRQSAVHCTADRSWCAQLFRDGEGEDQGRWSVHVFQGMPSPGSVSDRRRHQLRRQENSRAEFWPQLVRPADGAVLVGVRLSRSTGFSGGGASASHLELVRAVPASTAVQGVLEVPLGAGLDIRACFDAGDRRSRRGACSDQYEFSGTLTLDPATAAGPPRFRFVASARTYPGQRSRDEDSSTAPPLRRSDLAWAEDPACSYRRTFSWNAASERFEPDQPLPACAQYFDF